MCLLPGYLHPILACVIMGLTASFVGTCIQHDGSHGAFSNSKPINKAAGWTLDMIGASAFTWEIQHMLGHHPYTNLLDVEGIGGKMDGNKDGLGDDIESDPDVFSSYPFMRMHPHHTREWYHAYQHIYAPFLFSFMTLSKVLSQDVEIIRAKRLYHIDATCRYASILNVIRFWFMKALSFVYMVFLPCYFQGIGKGLLLFIIGHLTCGEMLATMFIVNHVIEGVAFAQKNDAGSGNTTSFKVRIYGRRRATGSFSQSYASSSSNLRLLSLPPYHPLTQPFSRLASFAASHSLFAATAARLWRNRSRTSRMTTRRI
jgi:linoleoyl-CoA desaturase